MLKLVTPDEAVRLDTEAIKEFCIPGVVLMENAALRVADRIQKRWEGNLEGKKIGILCGPGNNGGDGLAVARHLFQRGGIPVVLIIGNREKIKGDALINLNILEKLPVDISYIQSVEDWTEKKAKLLGSRLLVDSLFGTGLSRRIEGVGAAMIEWMNASGIPVLSVDIPSGIDGRTGAIRGTAVIAEGTVTFSFPKLGHCLYPGRDHTGILYVEDISIPPQLGTRIQREILEDQDIKGFLPLRRANTHKGNYGKLAVIAGSKGLVGAGALTATAALRMGCGLVTLGVPKSLLPVYETKMTEIMTFPLPDEGGSLGPNSMDAVHQLLLDKDCLAIGPGLGKRDGIFEILRNILEEYDIPIVIDADGINHICQDMNVLGRAKGEVILTPHPGEMARLTGRGIEEITRNPVEIAMEFAARWGITLILKGSTSVIAHRDGRLSLNLTGNPGMATGGSGDVLTGMIAALLCQGLDAYDATRVASYIHGKAGDWSAAIKGEYALTAGDIIEGMPAVLKELIGR
ncbi:MAG: NAD(P)H-hydrate dehydratase [Clostridia bacterium]|jgi:hydroxyethylthiazole kinase-like uncharacterized protein yjeF